MKKLDQQEITDIVGREFAHQKSEEVYFFFDFLRHFKIKNIVEIGTASGGMASLFKIYLPSAKVVSIDHVENEVARKKSREHGFEYIIGNSQDKAVVRKVIGMIGRIDLLFIDGSHEYKDVKKDFELWNKDAKIIAFHDIVWNCGKSGMSTATVWKFWNKIRDIYKPDHVKEIICSAYGGLVEHSGIGVVWERGK